MPMGSSVAFWGVLVFVLCAKYGQSLESEKPQLPLPLYNLPIHGQSMYNNYDPFVKGVKLLDMKDWLFRTRQRELINAESTGVEQTPMLLPPAPRVGVLPTLKNGIRKGVLPFTIALEESSQLRSNAAPPTAHAAAAGPPAPPAVPAPPALPAQLGELSLFAKGLTDMVPPVEPYPPASAVLNAPDPRDQAKGSAKSTADPNADLVNAIEQLIKEAQLPTASQPSAPTSSSEDTTRGAQVCPTGDCSVSSSQSADYVTPDVDDDSNVDPLTGKPKDSAQHVDPVAEALARAAHEIKLFKAEEAASAPATPAPTVSPAVEEQKEVAQAAAQALRVRRELLGGDRPYVPPHVNVEHTWDWTGPSVSTTFSDRYQGAHDLCNGSEDCDPVETVPKGYLDALVELQSNTASTPPTVENHITNTMVGSSNGPSVENDIKAPAQGQVVKSKNSIKNDVQDSTPHHLKNVIKGEGKTSPSSPENENSIANRVKNAQAFDIHNIVHSKHPDSRSNDIRTELTAVKGGRVGG